MTTQATRDWIRYARLLQRIEEYVTMNVQPEQEGADHERDGSASQDPDEGTGDAAERVPRQG